MDTPSRPARVALIPWGTPIEVFLDPLGRTLGDFCERLSGGWLFGYAEALAAAGYEPHIVVSSCAVTTRQACLHQATGTPMTVLPQPHRRPPRRHGWRRDLMGYRHALPHGLLRELAGYDIVLLQEYEEPRADLLSWWGVVHGIPVVASFQGGLPPWHRAPLQRLVRRGALQRLSGLLVGSADEIERLVKARGVDVDRVFAVANPVDVRAWSPQDRGAARRQLALPDDAFVVAWHGRVDLGRKGLDVLVDAWVRLRARCPGAELRLLLVGTGPDAAALQSLLDQPAVRGVDWLRRYAAPEQVRERLAACDVWVSASRHEGFAVAPLEAMACGRPVILTDVPGAAEVLAPVGKHVPLVPPGDASALTDALIHYKDLDVADLLECGRDARNSVAARFSVQAVSRQLGVALGAVEAADADSRRGRRSVSLSRRTSHSPFGQMRRGR